MLHMAKNNFKIFIIAMSCLLAACQSAPAPLSNPAAAATSLPAAPTPMPSQTPSPPPTPASQPTPPIPRGETQQAKFDSAVLKREAHYYIYLPPGYETGKLAYPVVYLLHGRGENMSSWARFPKEIEPLFAAGKITPFIAVMPDFPSQSRAGYYVDSQYTGADSPGEAVETFFFNELIPHIDRTYRTLSQREGRAVAGYSMGGYGAVRYLLAHPQAFLAGIALSPAIYVPLPPADSSTREFGAFGKGALKFDPEIYQALNYPALFASFSAARLKSHLFIAVGDDEYMNPNPADASHDLDFEAHLLYNQARRVEYLASELRVYDGAHSWDVWLRGFAEGMTYLSRYIDLPH